MLFAGKRLNDAIGVLREFSIPEPETGGLLCSVLIALLYLASGVEVEFDLAARDVLLVYFFTTIGINASLGDLLNGGKPLVILLTISIAYMFLQNPTGISVASLFDLPAAVGVIGGTVSLIGGHGTAIIVALPYAALLNQLWLPLVPQLLAWVLSAGTVMVMMRGSERSQRKLLMELFSRNVSADVAAEIWKQRDRFLEGGRLAAREVTATVLFSDLENFTPVSEKLGPARLMEWLNHYLETMAGLVMRHGGIVDDYYGDAIMADFGVPLVRDSAAGIDQDAQCRGLYAGHARCGCAAQP